MASISELRAALVSAYTSGGHVAAEQELYEDLMAHKPVLLNLFNFGSSNAQEQKQLESGKITIRGRSTAVNADFARQATFVAQKLNVSDLHIAEIMYGVTNTYPNLPPEILIERTVVAFHRRRRDIAECLRYIFFAAEQSSSPDAPQLFKRLDTFLRQHLLPPAKPQELPLASKLFKEIENLEGVLNSTLNARQSAGSDTFAPPNPGARLGSDILTARLDSLKHERRDLAAVLWVIGRMGCLSSQDLNKMVDWLEANLKHPLVHYFLPTVLASFDSIEQDPKGGQKRKELLKDRTLTSFMKRKLDVSSRWKEPGLKSTILLKWTLFCTEARHQDPTLEDTEGFRSNELETQIWNAIQGDCFVYLTRLLASLKQKHPLSSFAASLVGQPQDQENNSERPPADFSTIILEACEVLVRTLITYASSELRKIKQRQEDILLANARTDRTRSARSAPPPMHPRIGSEAPRNDMAVIFSFIGLLYSALSTDTALPYWGVIPRDRRHLFSESAISRLPSFLQWAVWSTPAHDLDMSTALYDMLTGLSNGEQCSELCYNFLARGGTDVGVVDPSSLSTPSLMVSGSSVSWSAMFTLLDTWVNSASSSRPNATLPPNPQLGASHSNQWQVQPQHPTHAQQQQRLTLTQQDVLLSQSFLRLLATVVTHSVPVRVTICSHARFRAIPTLMSLIPLSVPLELKGALFDTLSAFCTPGAGLPGIEICKSVWTLMERLEVINVRGNTGMTVKGVEVELEEVESAFKMYPATIAFLKLLGALLHTPKSLALHDQVSQEPLHTIPEGLGHNYRAPGVAPYTSFVVDNVFSNIPRREYLRPSDRWHINDLCLGFIERALASFELESLVTSVENRTVTREAVVQLAVHPGYDVMKRILTQSSLHTSILTYIAEGTDGFEKGFADEEPYFRSTIVRVLRIIHRVLEIQDIFLDIFIPLLFDLNDPAATGELHPASYFGKFDQSLLFSPEIVSAIVSYVAYPAHLELTHLAVKILSTLSTPSTAYQLAVVLERSPDSIRILDGFRHILDAESSADVEATEAVMEQNTGAGASDPTDIDGDCIQAVRTQILDFFIQNTRQDRPYPNVAHYLLFGRLDTGDRIQDPHSLGAQRTCMHSIVDLVNTGIPRVSKRVEVREAPLLASIPALAEKCYHVLFQLSKHPRTSDFTTRYLRSREDFFARHLVAMPFKSPIIAREPYIEVMYRDGSRVITTVPAFCSFLRLRSWVLDLAALELHILVNKGHHKGVSELLELLFGNAGESLQNEQVGWEHEAFRPFQEAGQSHIRMIEFLESLDIDWSDSLTPQPVEIEFLNTLDLQSCTRADSAGCEVIDRTALMAMVATARRTLHSQGRILTAVHAQQLDAETDYILQSCAVENHRRTVRHAVAASYESWRRVLDVSLIRCYSRLPENRRENMLLDLLHALPSALDSSNVEEATAVTLAESILTAITKLREDRRTVLPTDSLSPIARSLPAERLFSLLKSLIGCVLNNSRFELVRGNLYASLIQYLQLVMVNGVPTSDQVDLFATQIVLKGQENSRKSSKFVRSKEAQGSFAVIQPVAERLVSVISRDAVDGAEVWKTVAFVLLDSLVHISLPQQTVITALARSGYLSGFVQATKDSDVRLQAVLHPDPENLDALYVYEAKMSLFIKMAQSKAGAERLLEARLLTVLADCDFLDSRPEVGQGFAAERDSFLPGAIQRYHQLLIPALQLVAAILFTSGPKHTTANQQTIQFIRNHRDSLILLLKGEIDQVSLPTDELHVVIAMCTYALQVVPRTELLSSSGFGGLYSATRNLALKALDHQEWWKDLLQDPKTLRS
ncbi:hypothetical protein QCA50_014616 [Cerrena zonata]|uniref:Uncharacterized protein n=1 Tax=Cerrena zonata TaxID=2478898 RepID=A0AAW0FYG8_9APHY